MGEGGMPCLPFLRTLSKQLQELMRNKEKHKLKNHIYIPYKILFHHVHLYKYDNKMAGLCIELFNGLVKVFAVTLLSNKGRTFLASLSVLHYQE